jgi:hypothetical protein
MRRISLSIPNNYPFFSLLSMTNFRENAAATESLLASVAAAAVSASSTPAERQGLSFPTLPAVASLLIIFLAAFQYLATVANISMGNAALVGQCLFNPFTFSLILYPAPAPAPAPTMTAPTAATVGAAPIAAAAPPAPPAIDTITVDLYSTVPTENLDVSTATDTGELWYAVLKGKRVGVTNNHALALSAVVGVSNNSMKSHKGLATAVFYFNHALALGLVEIRPF